uniref:Uncharacterized protein n=1 Tax=viral metagenome TaxID=1070528 RepID=A0A6C0AJD1_9ZZZZ
MKLTPPVIKIDLLFLGIMMMLMNVGSRYIVDEFSSKEDEYQRNIFVRRVAIFAVCYMGTRDFVHALLLTGGFVVLSMGISRSHPVEGFREGSKGKLWGPYTNDPELFTQNGNTGTQRK